MKKLIIIFTIFVILVLIFGNIKTPRDPGFISFYIRGASQDEFISIRPEKNFVTYCSSGAYEDKDLCIIDFMDNSSSLFSNIFGQRVSMVIDTYKKPNNNPRYYNCYSGVQIEGVEQEPFCLYSEESVKNNEKQRTTVNELQNLDSISVSIRAYPSGYVWADATKSGSTVTFTNIEEEYPLGSEYLPPSVIRYFFIAVAVIVLSIFSGIALFIHFKSRKRKNEK